MKGLILMLLAGAVAAGAGSRAGIVRVPPEERGESREERAEEIGSSLQMPAEEAASTTDLRTFLESLPVDSEGNWILSRQLVLETTLRQNLRIRLAGAEHRIEAAEAVEEEARFDPELFGRLLRGESDIPSSSAFSQPFVIETRDDVLELGLRKAFRQGLDLSASVLATRFATNSTFQGLKPEYGPSVVVEAVQPLLAGSGRLVNTVDLVTARLESDAARRRFEAEAALVTAGSEVLYWQLVGNLAILGLRQDSIQRVEQLLEDTRARLEAGIIPISEVRQAESALAARREDLTRARREVERVVDTLATNLRIGEDVRVWELPIRTEPLPDPPEEAPPLDPLLDEALRRRAELEAARREEEAARNEAEAAGKELRPRLDLVADVEILGLSGNAVDVTDFSGATVRNPFGGSFSDGLDRLADGEFRDWSVGLELTWPIGNRAAKARRAWETHEAREAELERRRLEDRVRFEVLSAHKDLVAAMERARVAGEFVDLASRTVSDEEDRFAEGLSDTFRILELQDDLADAEVRRAQALMDVRRAMVELDVAVGRYLETRDLAVSQVPLAEVMP